MTNNFNVNRIKYTDTMWEIIRTKNLAAAKSHYDACNQAVSVCEITKPNNPPNSMVIRSLRSTFSFGRKAAIIQNNMQAPKERDAI